MKLLTSQKNQLFDFIVQKGLSPNSFDFQESVRQSTILYKGSEYQFNFNGDRTSDFFHVMFSPGNTSFFQKYEIVTWEFAIILFNNEWLNCLLREISLEDKWKRLEEEVAHLNLTFVGEDGKFSAAEYEELKQRMVLLKGNIKDLSLSPEQLKAIEEKLDHLTQIAIQINKFDWKDLFIGAIMHIILTYGVTPENGKALWELIKSAFNNYFLQ